MGAGSAKGVQQEEQEDDVDSFSSASSEHWENEGALPAPAAPTTNPKAKPPPPPPPPKHHEASSSSVAQIENGEAAEERKEKQKKKTAFGFSLRRDQQHTDKVDDVHNESSDDEANRERERKSEHKGDKGKDRKGFRLFGWRKDEKKHDKDEALDEDLDDLEKTFDSLGIVGKNMWGGTEKATPKQEEVLLSPMRKRKNVRGRTGVKGVNGTAVKANGVGSSGSTTSKRTFKFSWETDKQKSPIKDEDDEWEYKAVVIEGFDIEKFRKANLKESVFDSNSLPNVVGGEDESRGSKKSKSSPLRYDQTEQYILASIERDFTS